MNTQTSELRVEPTARELKQYSSITKYRDPRIYKVSEGTVIMYINEPQYLDWRDRVKTANNKVKLIGMFKNVK